MQFWCQLIIAFNFTVAFFVNVYRDFNGRPAKEPLGFTGFVATFIVITLLVWVYAMAGAFSELKWW